MDALTNNALLVALHHRRHRVERRARATDAPEQLFQLRDDPPLLGERGKRDPEFRQTCRRQIWLRGAVVELPNLALRIATAKELQQQTGEET